MTFRGNTYLYSMFQELAIAFTFLAAIGYIGNAVYQNFQSKKACSSGCGKCGAIDISKIEKQFAADQKK